MAFLVLQAELDERFGILGILSPYYREGRKSIDSLEDAEDAGLEFLRRRSVASDPVNLFPVRSQKEKERSAADVEFLEQLLAEGIASQGPEEDEILIKKLGEPGFVIKLLDQQLTVASTVFLEKIEEKEFTRDLRFGLGIFEGSHLPILAEG